MLFLSMDYDYLTTMFSSIFAHNVQISGRKYIFTIFAYELFKVKMKNCKYYQKYLYIGSKYF